MRESNRLMEKSVRILAIISMNMNREIVSANFLNGVVAMAEEYVSKDQHRADLLELRGELKEEIAGIRQDVAVLSKNVEHLALQVNDLKADVSRQFGELRQDNRNLQTAVQRQMWALIAVVAGGVIKILFFP